jgi:hypothetical protein
MSGYLAALVDRHLAAEPEVRPRALSAFEPAPAVEPFGPPPPFMADDGDFGGDSTPAVEEMDIAPARRRLPARAAADLPRAEAPAVDERGGPVPPAPGPAFDADLARTPPTRRVSAGHEPHGGIERAWGGEDDRDPFASVSPVPIHHDDVAPGAEAGAGSLPGPPDDAPPASADRPRSIRRGRGDAAAGAEESARVLPLGPTAGDAPPPIIPQRPERRVAAAAGPDAAPPPGARRTAREPAPPSTETRVIVRSASPGSPGWEARRDEDDALAEIAPRPGEAMDERPALAVHPVAQPAPAAVSDDTRRGEAAAPVIEVHIGRIEVRATPAREAPQPARRAAAGVTQLDEYLRRRERGGR